MKFRSSEELEHKVVFLDRETLNLMLTFSRLNLQ